MKIGRILVIASICVSALAFTAAMAHADHADDRAKDRIDEIYERYQEAEPPTHLGEVGYIKLKKLHPTQIGYGERERESKYEKLLDFGKHKRRKYLLKNIIPVVLFNDQYYLVDHHLFALGLMDYGKNKTLIRLVRKMEADSEEEFYAQMIDENLAFPYDTKGNRLTPKQMAQKIPSGLEDMVRDQFRDLAGDVRDAGGFEKAEGAYFLDSVWANYFRKNIKIGRGEGAYKEAVKEGTRLALSPASSHMPGFIGAGNKCAIAIQPKITSKIAI